MEVSNSTIAVGDEQGAGGRLTLTGERVSLSGTTELSARGSTAGGLIQVGGSWQNSDPSVREAVEASVDSDVVLDASSIDDGDGGEIVVWSDITNTSSLTKVSGQLLAEGGVNGGHGGRIETSGATLDVDGIRVHVQSLEGWSSGKWLLDPFDYTIDSATAQLTFFSIKFGDEDITITTDISSQTIGTSSILADNPSDDSGGTITVSSPIAVASPGGGDLSLVADKDIVISAQISTVLGSKEATLRCSQKREYRSAREGVLIGILQPLDRCRLLHLILGM